MPNTLGNYTEIFFAQEALIQLENQLGMASRVFRDYDATPANKGDTIRLRKPSTFTAQNAPSSSQALNTDSNTITLDQWKEVKFDLTDKELTLSADRLIEDHIRPAAYALAKEIDDQLCQLTLQVPWIAAQQASTFALADLAQPQKVLFDNGAPEQDGNLHLMVGGSMRANIVGTLGGANMFGTGVDQARTNGQAPMLYGFKPFANQGTLNFTTSQMADVDGTLTSGVAAGVGVISISGLTISQAAGIKKGDTLVIAGNRQRYAVLADASTDGAGVAATVSIYPNTVAAYSGSAVINIDKRTGAKESNLAFHRNFAALSMAPLSRMGSELGGVRMSIATDPKTALALRASMWYNGDERKVKVALDCLFGVKMLDPNLATRWYSF